MTVPFLDLTAHHAPLRAEIDTAMSEVIGSNALAGGPFVTRFEEDFAAFLGAPQCVGVGSGTDALWLALLALGVGPGDEVITCSNSFIATAEAITWCGARPVFVDIDPHTHTMDPERLSAAITARTRAVIPIHLFGQTADMGPILDICRQRGLFLVEDACQAHGARWNGACAGTIGHAAAFSFYPGKNLGAWGEAGAVTTGDPDLAARIRRLRDHGQSAKYYHDVVGVNGRMDGIQAAVLRVKLTRLAGWNQARRRHAALYSHLLEDTPGLTLPHEAEYAEHVYHLFVVRSERRDALIAHLAGRGIATGIHYPVPIHRTVAYASLNLPAGSLPETERAADEVISLPMFPELTEDQIRTVADAVREFQSR